MDIIIPTCGRWNYQPTLIQLKSAGLNPVMVVQAQEFSMYRDFWDGEDVPIYRLPSHIRTIAPTRQWILENVGADENFCMCDDDLVFYKRRDDDPTKLRDITDLELALAFSIMENYITPSTPHIGFAAREGANRNTERVISNTRIMRVLGYHRQTLIDEDIRFNRLDVMEDFDVALQLLERGYPNIVLNEFAHNQAGSGKAGGCSTFRTPALHATNAVKLAALHPRYVKVVEKTTKGAWGGGTRTDVQIQWKKAINEAILARK